MKENFVEVPGLREVVTAQREALEGAFFVTDTRIRGYRVRPLTAEHMAALFRLGSPFVTGKDITATDVAEILWILSPRWKPRSKPPRVRQMLFAFRVGLTRDLDGLAAGVSQYLADTFEVQPQVMQKKGASGGPSVECGYLAHITHRILSAYSITRREVETTPLVVLWQWIRLIQADAMGKDYHEITAGDKHSMHWQSEQKAKQQAREAT